MYTLANLMKHFLKENKLSEFWVVLVYMMNNIILFNNTFISCYTMTFDAFVQISYYASKRSSSTGKSV